MSLSRVREKYPEFADMSDKELADSLYKSHYSNIPRAEYNKRLGIKDDASTKGAAGIANDFFESAQSFPKAALNMVAGIPGGIAAAFKRSVTNPAAANLAGHAGIAEGVISMINAKPNIMQYLSDKGFISKERADKAFRVPNLGMENILGIGGQDEGDQFIKALSSFLIPGKAAKALLPERVAVPAAMATMAVGENQDPVHAALMGIIGDTIVKKSSQYERSPGGGFRKDWTKQYSSPLSNEELQANLQAAGNTQTGLGRVINNPELMKYLETESRKYPESGSEEIMGNTANQIKDIGSGLIDEIKGDTPIEHYGDEVLNALKASKKDVTKEKISKYKVVNDLADKHGVTTPRTNFINVAREELKAAEDDPHLSLFSNAAEKAKLKKIVDEAESNPNKQYSLRDNDYLIGKIGEELQSHFEKGNKSEVRLYKDLHEALKKDRNDAIENLNSPKELKDAHKQANDFYKNEYAAFDDPDIAKWLRQGGDTDLLINHFIRKGKFSDRSKLIKKLQDKLPKDKKHILGSAYLSNAIKDGEFSPHQARSLWKGLGEKQRDALFTPDQITKLSDFSKLTDMNPEALSLMLNPKTGFRDSSAPTIKDVLMPIVAASIGGHFGGILPGLAAASIPYLAGKIKPKFIVKPKVDKMTSPEFRKQFIEKLIEKRKTMEYLKDKGRK